MATKTKKIDSKFTTKKEPKSPKTKSSTKEPTSTTLLKRVAGVSDSTKTLSKEIKAMTKIFSENQKVLVSMKNMIDSLSSALEQIQKQSRRINIIEEDTQKIFSGLSQVRGQSDLVLKINNQTSRLQDQINKITESQKASPETKNIMQKVSDSFESIRNNSKMIMTISERIDNVRNNLKQELESVVSKANSMTGITEQLDEMKRNIQSISSRTGNIGGDMINIKNELGNIASKTDEKISGLSSILNRSDASSSEFHKKTNQIIQELQGIKSASNKSSEYTSKEMVGLLKLSEYQSNIRMQAESKYGSLADLEKMATQTAQMVNLFDKLSIESNEKMVLPHEVRQWAVSKILDCADRWEIRFTDVFQLLVNQLGRDLLKEALRIQQVRYIFGIRAVDEIRREINIS